MYADVEAPRINQQYIQEPLYLSEDQEKYIIDNGGLVMRYDSLDSPVYEYSIETALDEYHLKAYSVFVYGFIGFFTVLEIGFYIKYQNT
jgi:hypothetical protein